MKEGDEAEGTVRLTHQGPDCLCRDFRFDFSCSGDLVKVSSRMVVCVCERTVCVLQMLYVLCVCVGCGILVCSVCGVLVERVMCVVCVYGRCVGAWYRWCVCCVYVCVVCLVE